MTDDLIRCNWCLGDEAYIAYHDAEWGVPIREVAPLFYLLTLEGMQAGLSWLTILRKRAAMRDAFHGFDLERLATSDESDIGKWLTNPDIIRHRGKLAAMINNAKCVLEMDDFVDFIWQFQPRKRIAFDHLGAVPAQTAESSAMSKALKRAGFKFVGPTTCYAFMQSAGLVNDHVTDCWRFADCESMAS
jgi:DNA-3-methyladenine glycosylase I